MKKYLIISGVIALVFIAAGITGVLWHKKISRNEYLFSSDPMSRIMKVIIPRYGVMMGRLTLPDIDLTAGNKNYPCERGNLTIDKMVDGRHYPIFLYEDLLRYGTSTRDDFTSRSLYAFDGNDVYYLDFEDCGKIAGADKESFRAIAYRNAVDKNHAYFAYKAVDGADPASYKLYEKLNGESIGGWWAQDKDSVFYKGDMVSRLSGVKELGNGWVKTDTKIFYLGYPIEVIDPESFVRVSGNFQKDKRHIYIKGKVIEGGDPASFQVVDNLYLKDNTRIYFGNSDEGGFYNENLINAKIFTTKIDTKTFQAVKEGSGFYKDKNHVYAGNGGELVIFNGVDVDFFEVIGECGCVEKSCAYYSKDSWHVFCGSTMVKDADPSSFSVIGFFQNRIFNGFGMPTREAIAKDKSCIFRRERQFLNEEGVCVKPSSCTGDFIEQKNGKLCGHPFLRGNGESNPGGF